MRLVQFQEERKVDLLGEMVVLEQHKVVQESI